MARRKVVEPSPEELDQESPRELLRFCPSQPPHVTADGRPTPWAVKWSADDFAAFLRARAAWRAAHDEPLPGLPGRERCAMHRMDLPSGLIKAEEDAPRRPPEWWARRRTTTTTNEGRN